MREGWVGEKGLIRWARMIVYGKCIHAQIRDCRYYKQ